MVPDFQRYPKFSTINSEDISHFKKILGDRGVVQDEDTLDSVNTDWMGKYKGSSKLMLRPKSTEEVDIYIYIHIIFFPFGNSIFKRERIFFPSVQISQILKYCNSRSLAVVPQGGNTGLVGGSVPVFDEVIYNFLMVNCELLSFS